MIAGPATAVAIRPERNERRDAAFVQLSSAIQGLNTPLVNLLENVTADIRAIVEPKPTWIEKLLGR